MYGLFVPASGSKTSIFSFKNIYQCYLECRRKKRNTYNALRFEINAEANIFKLEQELNSRIYYPSHSILFAAKKPKIREIFAADFRDRIVHHILVNELEKVWEPIFIHDSYACRDNKGTHKAVTRLQEFLRKITKNGHIRVYYLQLDIKDFFTSIDKELLFKIIKYKVSNPELLWLTETILFWDCTKAYIRHGNKSLLSDIPSNKSLFGKENLCGLPIGNLTSQFFANVYLNELDQFIKHTLKVHYYLRYVDDFMLLGQNKEDLLCWKEKIRDFLYNKLNLQLHPRRQKLQPVSNGINFLGYIIRHNYILVRLRVINNLKAKLKRLKDYPDKLRDSIASYLGHFKWADSYNLVKKLSLNTD